jgi:putative protein-disulfide isomerase
MTGPAATQLPRLIVFSDAMCSWCYALAPELDLVLAGAQGRFEPYLQAGGLRPFNTEPWDEKTRDFIRHHWDEIGKVTGRPFDFARLEKADFVYDSAPASRAIVTLRAGAPRAVFAYQAALQDAFYRDGRDITDPGVLADMAAGFGLERDGFLKAFHSAEAHEAMMDDFRLAQRVGVKGFPTIVLHRNERLFMVASGYTKAPAINEAIENAFAWVPPEGAGAASVH